MSGLMYPGGSNKKQPLASMYSAFSANGVTSGMSVSFSKYFSSVKSNNGKLTCLMDGKYKISAAMRCRFCYFYVFLNSDQILLLDGHDMNAADTGIVEKEIEIELSEGDILTYNSVRINPSTTDRFSIFYANVFKA